MKAISGRSMNYEVRKMFFNFGGERIKVEIFKKEVYHLAGENITFAHFEMEYEGRRFIGDYPADGRHAQTLEDAEKEFIYSAIGALKNTGAPVQILFSAYIDDYKTGEVVYS